MEADSDVMLAVFNPYREKLTNYRGYDIKTLKHNFRSVILLKNRYGDGDVAVGYSYFGGVNFWKEFNFKIFLYISLEASFNFSIFVLRKIIAYIK